MKFEQLGQYLKECRVDKGLTQKALANKLGNIHTQFVCNWERGMCAPPNHCFVNLLQMLKVDRNKIVDIMLEDSRSEIESIVFGKEVAKRQAFLKSQSILN